MFRVSLEKHSGVNSQQLAPRKPLEQGSQTCLAPTSHCTFYTPSQPSFLPTLQLQQGNALLSTLLSAHYGHICHYIATYCFKHYKKENSVMRKKIPLHVSKFTPVHLQKLIFTHLWSVAACRFVCSALFEWQYFKDTWSHAEIVYILVIFCIALGVYLTVFLLLCIWLGSNSVQLNWVCVWEKGMGWGVGMDSFQAQQPKLDHSTGPDRERKQ